MTLDDRRYRQRWWIFSILTLMYILVCFYRVSLGVVAGDVARELNLSPQQLGTLSCVLLYVYAVAQLPLGPMIDRLGSRTMICWCGVLAAIGGVLFSQAHSLPVAMAARVLIGIGTASVLMATFTIFSRWFSLKEFGRVSGLMIAIGNLGTLSATAPLALSVAAIGWRSSFLVIGGGQILVTLLVFRFVQDRPPGATVDQAAPEQPQASGVINDWREIFSARDFWFLAGIAFFQYGNFLALQGLWGGLYLMEVLQLSRSTTGQMLLFSSLGAVTGALFVDVAARKFFRSYKKTLLTGQTLFMLLMTGFLGVIELLPLPLLGAGFFALGVFGSSGVLTYPIIRSMFPLRVVGTALTSINFFVLMGAAVTQQVMGYIMGSYGSGDAQVLSKAYHAAFLFPIAGLATAIVFFLFSKDYWARQNV